MDDTADIGDSLAARIDTVYCDGQTVGRLCCILACRLDGQALAVDNGRVGLISLCRRVFAAVQVLEVLGQFQVHDRVAIAIDSTRDNGDIVGSPIICIVLLGIIERRAAEFQLMV